jgi:hypothetical protein
MVICTFSEFAKTFMLGFGVGMFIVLGIFIFVGTRRRK